MFPEFEYTFKHALTQDVAYASLKEDHRRVLHAGVVDAIEHLYAERLSEHAERLAHHAFRGGLWRRAAAYSRQAGMKAFDRSANREAVASLEQALTALAHVPEDRESLEEAIDVRLVLRSALLQLGEIRRMAERVREAETLALAAGDQGRLAWVWTYMTICHLFDGAPREAVALGERAFALAEDVGDVALRATARTPWAHAYREVGRYGRAIELLRGTIDALSGDLARQRLGQGMPPALYARNVAAMCLAELGDFGEAVTLGSESVEIAEALDVPFGAVLGRIALGQTYLVQDRVQEAAGLFDAALALIDARDIPAWFPWAAAGRGYARALDGHAAEAVGLLQQAIDRADGLRFLFGHSQWVSWLAHAHALAGNFTEADRRGDEALRLSRDRGERGYEAWILHVLGEVAGLSHAAGSDEGMAIVDAERHQRAALARATELGMRPLVARCERALARVASACGRDDEAQEHRRRAVSLFAALGMPDVDR
jgi:tetratricopeptide (TPR) repeat protein